MANPKTDPRVDLFFQKAKKWREEMELLRSIVLESGLTEELKWYQPCYTYQGNNVAIISGFKDYCLLGIFKGALLKDAKGILNKPGENTQSARQVRFTSTAGILKLKSTLKAYLKEAIANEKAGKKVAFKKITEHVIPEELQRKFKTDKALQTAFRSLTPGRQRAYLLYFSGAKQSATREARIEKCAPRIKAGKGLGD